MYRHYWAYQPSHPAYQRAWPAIIDDTASIIEQIRRLGIVIAGSDGFRRPVIDPLDGIEFNGDASTDLAADAFQLLARLPEHRHGTPTATAHCTTNRKPYDLAVTAVLLHCTLLVPEVFAVASDGRWDAEWAARSSSWPRGAIGQSPRRVVADLFGTHSSTNPLRDKLAVARFPATLAPARAAVARQFQVGQPVHVHAYGSWRPGTVTRIGRTRVTVRYLRNADGQADEQAFTTAEIRPALGVALVPVHRLRSGDVVIDTDGTKRTVADLRQHRHRRRTVHYTDGSEADLPAQANVRVQT